MSRTLRLLLSAAAIAAAVPIVAFSIAMALAPEPTDFMCFWSGAALVSRGQDPYDPGTWSAAVGGLFPNWLGLDRRPPCPGSYGYPLWTAIATLPLGILPLGAAAFVWMLLLTGGVAAGVFLLARSAGLTPRRTLLFATITFASQPAWLTALTSQYGGVDLAALGLLALPGTSMRPGRFSVAMVLLLLKPHIAPLVLVERARAAAPRARLAAGAAALGLVVTSLLVRPSWPVEWIDELVGHRAAIAGTSATLYGLSTWLSGQITLGLVVVALALVAFTLSLRGAHIDGTLDRVAIAVTMGLLAVPYLSSGDPIVLATAWCAILRRAGTRPIGIILGLIVAADVVPWVLYVMREPVAPPGDIRNALEIPVTAALLAIALRRTPSVLDPRAVPAVAQSLASR